MGFPHSEISGSPFATNSPDLFAGNRVLHRPQAPRHPPCALCSLTYYSSIQPGPRTGRADAADSPINDRYISLLAKLAFVFHLHLLRCTTRSFELARGHTCTRTGSNKPVEAGCDPLTPSCRHTAGADLESYVETAHFAWVPRPCRAFGPPEPSSPRCVSALPRAAPRFLWSRGDSNS